MQKTEFKIEQRSAEVASRVKKTADICGVSTRHVYRVINADSFNEKIMSVYMQLQEGENALLEEVKKLVPFN